MLGVVVVLEQICLSLKAWNLEFSGPYFSFFFLVVFLVYSLVPLQEMFLFAAFPIAS